MTKEEISALEKYIENGGKAAICGPAAYPSLAEHWTLPTRADVKPENFFRTSDGIRILPAAWTSEMKLSPSKEANEWKEIKKGLFYNPHRVCDGEITESTLQLCREHGRKNRISVAEAKGYFITAFENGSKTLLHFLAEDYDTDIDHKLDEMRFHRSRVNFVNKAEPVGTKREIVLNSTAAPTVYTPFNDRPAEVELSDGKCTVTLPESCGYAILSFEKQN